MPACLKRDGETREQQKGPMGGAECGSERLNFSMQFSFLSLFFSSPFRLFVIYLKIEQAHSGFHKGDQSHGFRQWTSFQAALKPVNKLNTQGGLGVKSLEISCATH